MWVQNVSKQRIKDGDHYLDANTVLIQIQDVCTEFVVPKYASVFKEIHQFEFMDDADPEKEENINEKQAKQIAEILINCHARKLNIVVHCHAGVCRSGAVAEVAEMMGFDYAGNYKLPNTLVKQRILGDDRIWKIAEEHYASKNRTVP